MHLSFWGIGSANTYERGHDMNLHQQNEMGFVDAITKPGTQFRFKQDPDQTIYTITESKEENVYNYEAKQGYWGWEDGSGNSPPTCDGGGGIGKGICPPYGNDVVGEAGIAGKDAYVSDLLDNQSQYGGHPMNYR